MYYSSKHDLSTKYKNGVQLTDSISKIYNRNEIQKQFSAFLQWTDVKTSL